tara:strand:- start:225 stop:470 length:246 start_codon:yes stop_codon:yes gene_type:complete
MERSRLEQVLAAGQTRPEPTGVPAEGNGKGKGKGKGNHGGGKGKAERKEWQIRSGGGSQSLDCLALPREEVERLIRQSMGA